MEIKLASNYGFCFGVKRAIKIAEEYKNSSTMGPLIHNQDEIDRLKKDFNVGLYTKLDDVKDNDTVIIRTHGIPKNDLKTLKQQNAEVKGVASYGENPDDVHIIMEVDELDNIIFKNNKIATVAQTTKKKEKYLEIVNSLILKNKEVRVFNTICDATFENQDAARELSKEVDIMIVIGGKNSSNTKQLHSICLEYCNDSYLVENESELDINWFKNKSFCGITAGASTPDWIIQQVINKIKSFE